jgi:hypothetical protein
MRRSSAALRLPAPGSPARGSPAPRSRRVREPIAAGHRPLDPVTPITSRPGIDRRRLHDGHRSRAERRAVPGNPREAGPHAASNPRSNEGKVLCSKVNAIRRLAAFLLLPGHGPADGQDPGRGHMRPVAERRLRGHLVRSGARATLCGVRPAHSRDRGERRLRSGRRHIAQASRALLHPVALPSGDVTPPRLRPRRCRRRAGAPAARRH